MRSAAFEGTRYRRVGIRVGDDGFRGTVGQRLLDPIPEGDEFSGTAFGPYIQGLVEEYYDEMDWDVSSGRPYKSTLERHDIGEFAETIW